MARTFIATLWRRGTGYGSSVAVEVWVEFGTAQFLVYEIARRERQLIGGAFADKDVAIQYARDIVSGKVERPFV